MVAGGFLGLVIAIGKARKAASLLEMHALEKDEEPHEFRPLDLAIAARVDALEHLGLVDLVGLRHQAGPV